MTLPGSIQTAIGAPGNMRIGVITGTDPAQVTIESTVLNPAAVGFLDGYVPVLGDVVAVSGQSAQPSARSASWLVHGRIVSSPPAAFLPYTDRISVNTPVSEVTFTVPDTLQRLTIVYAARSTVAAASTAIRARINGDTSANYHTHMIQAVGAGAAAGSATAGATSWIVGVLMGDTSPSNWFSAGEMVFPVWDAPNPTLSAIWRNTSISSGGVTDNGGGIFDVGGPYSSVTLFPDGGNNFVAGSDFQLIGWP